MFHFLSNKSSITTSLTSCGATGSDHNLLNYVSRKVKFPLHSAPKMGHLRHTLSHSIFVWWYITKNISKKHSKKKEKLYPFILFSSWEVYTPPHHIIIIVIVDIIKVIDEVYMSRLLNCM